MRRRRRPAGPFLLPADDGAAAEIQRLGAADADRIAQRAAALLDQVQLPLGDIDDDAARLLTAGPGHLLTHQARIDAARIDRGDRVAAVVDRAVITAGQHIEAPSAAGCQQKRQRGDKRAAAEAVTVGGTIEREAHTDTPSCAVAERLLCAAIGQRRNTPIAYCARAAMSRRHRRFQGRRLRPGARSASKAQLPMREPHRSNGFELTRDRRGHTLCRTRAR